ncbi:MAG: transglutaminase-like domain-containing protein [Planctomycetota bacterium]
MQTLRHPFDELVQTQGEAVRVAHAALLFALDEYPALDMPSYLGKLDTWATRVDRIGASSVPDRIAALHTVLVVQEHFTGGDDDYYDPRNSYLNIVMDRKRGLPITLATIWLDVADRLKWGFEGVNFPGHFLLRCSSAGEVTLIAPFDGGRIVDLKECETILRNIFGDAASLQEEHLRRATPLMTLTRMLNNLRGVYARGQEWGKAMRVVRRMLAIEPESKSLAAEFEEFAARQARMN